MHARAAESHDAQVDRLLEAEGCKRARGLLGGDDATHQKEADQRGEWALADAPVGQWYLVGHDHQHLVGAERLAHVAKV